ncbi:MAG: class I SAM-dependent methyltransferase [Pseudomonadota bacterium]|nr:class I SAM-dependent methyltransferase [Pseudomonadota bacterium]
MSRELFRSMDLPVLQNRMFASALEAKASPMGDVVLVQDERTGLIFNAAFDASLLRYDVEYQNEQACSPAFQRHLEDVAAIITRHCKGQRLIEVGCGKGYFLELLRSLGFDITGIDPAYEGGNPDVITARFERGLGLTADVIVLRHVLEHISDPMAFLSDVCEANGGQGLIYIEVPCFDWILQRGAWYDIYYEHVNYFRLDDFDRMFGQVHERGRLFGEQYLYLVADLASLRRPRATSDDRVAMPADFLAGIDRTIAIIENDNGKANALWGAASKGVIFSVYLQRAGLGLDVAIDINPAKQGRFLAGSGLRVCAPRDASGRLRAGDNIFVMNSNYLAEITDTSDWRYSYFTLDHGAEAAACGGAKGRGIV